MNNYIKVFRIKCDNVQYSLAFIIIIVFRNFNGNNVAFHSIVVRIVQKCWFFLLLALKILLLRLLNVYLCINSEGNSNSVVNIY